MPNAFDPISARMIENAGFKAVQCSGYSFSIRAAYSKESEVTLEDNLEWTRQIVNAVDVPVMAEEGWKQETLVYWKALIQGLRYPADNLLVPVNKLLALRSVRFKTVIDSCL